MDTAPPPVVLTEVQRRVLWLQSVGVPQTEIARRLNRSLWGVKDASKRILHLLGAGTTAQAVRNGLLDGHIGPYEDCGSLAAYRRHIRDEEPTCPACKRGNRERADTEAALRLRRSQLSEPEVRLIRALDAGRTLEQISTRWNVSYSTIRKLTDSAYRTLGVDHLPKAVRRESALREARARGLLAVRMPDQPLTPGARVTLSPTQVKVLVELENGATLSETARRLGMHPGTCATRLSEAYRRLDVAWMDKGVRREEALRRARLHGLLPETATT